MKAMKESLELRDDRVFIIPGVPDEGATRRSVVSDKVRSVGVAQCEWIAPQKGSVTGVEIRLVIGAAAVNIVQIERRGAKVGQGVRIILFLQRTDGIKCYVMVDELAQIRV